MDLINTPIAINELTDNLFIEKKIKVYMIRLDEIHPVVSGNKIFKLHYFLEACETLPNPEIITYGGRYSNHLLASAYAASRYHIPITGMVKGEIKEWTPTLLKCREYGMQIQFVSNAEYRKNTGKEIIRDNRIIIPEGGYHPLGARGASLIMEKLTHLRPTDIICATGTATTIAGLMQRSKEGQKIISVPAVKNFTDSADRLRFLEVKNTKRVEVWQEFHFGGFARYNTTLIHFMNEFYKLHGIPLDFVYTAKMMFGVYEKIKSGFFPGGSIIACIHTGGLQGNVSIRDQLLFDV